jgi:Protein of unknown function (DUF3074)
MSSKSHGNLVHIVPLELSDLPHHPSFLRHAEPGASPQTSDTHLLTFLITILDEASAFLSPETFSTTFKSLSAKSSPPSVSPVELSKREIPSSEITSIDWSENQKVPRKKPAKVEDETWFARRSLHKNDSSKTNEGTASWQEFVFGIKEQHSKHEQDFTPTLYDAHYVLDWNDEVKKLEEADPSGEPGIEGENGKRYADVTMESTSPEVTSIIFRTYKLTDRYTNSKLSQYSKCAMPSLDPSHRVASPS